MVLADVITPNIPETEVLTGMTVDSADSMEKAAIKIYEHLKTKGGNAAVLVKVDMQFIQLMTVCA